MTFALWRACSRGSDRRCIRLRGIVEVTRHQNSGLDYISILPCSGTTPQKPISVSVGCPAFSTASQSEECSPQFWLVKQNRGTMEPPLKEHNIFVTEPDMSICVTCSTQLWTRMSKGREHLAMLEDGLDRAHLVSAAQVPADVITMNSKVRMAAQSERGQLFVRRKRNHAIARYIVLCNCLVPLRIVCDVR